MVKSRLTLFRLPELDKISRERENKAMLRRLAERLTGNKPGNEKTTQPDINFELVDRVIALDKNKQLTYTHLRERYWEVRRQRYGEGILSRPHVWEISIDNEGKRYELNVSRDPYAFLHDTDNIDDILGNPEARILWIRQKAGIGVTLVSTLDN